MEPHHLTPLVTHSCPSNMNLKHFQNRDERNDKEGQNKVVKTLTQYSLSSSLHGIQYVFESGKNLFASRFIWIVIVLAAATIGILLSIQVSRLRTNDMSHFSPNFISYMYFLIMIHEVMLQAYETWQDNPVLTSLHTTGLPISEIDFPAITICGQGSIYEV